MSTVFTKNTTKTSVEVLEKCLPTVIINHDALKKMNIYIKECSKEIGWLGTVIKQDNYYYISDVMLFDQEVHATTTEITPEGLSEFGEELLSKEDGIEIWNSIKLWGHSHVDMGVFASAQDNQQMVTFADNGHDFFIRIIANKKGEMKLDLYDYSSGVIYENLHWTEQQTEEVRGINNEIYKLQKQIEELELQAELIEVEILENMRVEIKEEMDEKVRDKVTTVYKAGETYWDNKSQKYIDIPKKKEKEEEKEIVASLYDVSDLEDWVIAEIKWARSVYEAEEILELYGYEGVFSRAEVLEIMSMSHGY